MSVVSVSYPVWDLPQIFIFVINSCVKVGQRKFVDLHIVLLTSAVVLSNDMETKVQRTEISF